MFPFTVFNHQAPQASIERTDEFLAFERQFNEHFNYDTGAIALWNLLSCFRRLLLTLLLG